MTTDNSQSTLRELADAARLICENIDGGKELDDQMRACLREFRGGLDMLLGRTSLQNIVGEPFQLVIISAEHHTPNPCQEEVWTISIGRTLSGMQEPTLLAVLVVSKEMFERCPVGTLLDVVPVGS
jgi:hypothetical protein